MMKITVQPFKLPMRTRNVCYIATVEKRVDKTEEYIIDIERLPSQFHEIFAGDYSPHTLQNDFYLFNFYTLEAVMTDSPLFSPGKEMNFSWLELKEFMLKAVGGAITDFVAKYAPQAVVAIPVRPGLGKLYDEVLSENEQNSGYHYVSKYREWGIYVIET
jgi:hypothetical protein